MNFLAHALLARGHDEWIIGSMIADFRPYPPNLPVRVHEGIELHHLVDSYVDKNEHFLAIRTSLRSEAGLFAPVVADICCDNLLIDHWDRYSDQHLTQFTRSVYEAFRTSGGYLPVPWRHSREDWLASYGSREGLVRSMLRMKKKLKSTRRFPNVNATLDLYFDQKHDLIDPFVKLFDELEREAERWKLDLKARF